MLLLFAFDPFYVRRNFRSALTDIVFEGGTMFYAGSITMKSREPIKILCLIFLKLT